MSVNWLVQIKTLGVFLGWLIIILPLFTVCHQRLSSFKGITSLASLNPLEWFLKSWKILVLQSKNQIPFHTRFFIQLLILFSLLLSLTILAALPLANQFLDLNNPLLLKSSGEFSLFFILALLFLLGFIYTAIAFLLKPGLLQLTILEQFISRQSFILMIAFACLTLTFTTESKNLHHIALKQTFILIPHVPAWGIILNPIAFVIASIALAFYTRQWINSETFILGNLRKTLDAHLNGVLLLTFKIARNLEFLAIYALLVTVFLAGPFLSNAAIFPLTSLTVFTLKILLLVFFVVFLNRLLPNLPENRVFRLMLLVLLPLNIIGYVIAQWYVRFIILA